MFQFYQENGKYYSRTNNFQNKPLPLARQPGGKRKAPHRRITYLNIPFLQRDLIVCESDLERDCAIIVSLNPEVLRIDAQPQKFDLGFYGEYTPDFMVTYKSLPPSYIEAKPDVFAQEPETWEKILAAHRYFKSKGVIYELMTDLDIEKKNRHFNATYIHRCAKLAIPAQQSQAIIDVVNRYPKGIRVEDLQAITGLLTDHILHCVGQRQITLNHFFEYQPLSMVYPLQGECK